MRQEILVLELGIGKEVVLHVSRFIHIASDVPHLFAFRFREERVFLRKLFLALLAHLYGEDLVSALSPELNRKLLAYLVKDIVYFEGFAFSTPRRRIMHNSLQLAWLFSHKHSPLQGPTWFLALLDHPLLALPLPGHLDQRLHPIPV